VGITDMVQPIHLYGIGRKEVATTGVRHPRRENEGADAPLRVWCDGSKDQSGKVGFAVWFHEGHPCNHSQRIADGSENFTAELHAAISALLLHDPNRDFECYSDCEKVVQVLNDRSRTLPRHPLEAGWLQAARDVQSLRDSLGRNTTFLHVYSHLLDSERPAPETMTKMVKMRERFGSRTSAVLEGNRAADALAKASLNFIRVPPLVTHMPQMPKFLLVAKEGGQPLNDVPKYVYQKRQREHRAALLDPKKNDKYSWLEKQGVDWKRSDALRNNPSIEVEAMQIHSHKSKHGFLGTKESRWKHRDEAFFDLTFRGIRVTNPNCDLCAEIEGVPILETRVHYLYCASHKEERARTTTRILERINRDTIEPVSCVPNYWNAAEKGQHPDPRWVSIEADFGPEHAAMGLVPRLWIRFLESLARNDNSDLERLINDCQLILVEGSYKCWRKRCKVFYSAHPKRPPDLIV